MAIITIIFAAVLPQFRAIKNGWDSRREGADVIQNGRVLIDHISRNLAKAVRINDVSESTELDGFIEFQDNDGNNFRYDVNSTTSFVEFGLADGVLYDLAGPVNDLQFTCYDACDLDTPLDITTADINDIRYVEVQTTLINSLSADRNKIFTAAAYLRTNDEASSECDPNLVAWWKLDETSGLNANDSSLNDNDGTLSNMAGTEWTDGIIEGALGFDGSNDYMAIQNFYYDGSSYPEVTVTAWIRTTDGSDQIIASYDRNEYWRLEINGNGGGTGQVGWDVRTSGGGGQVDSGSTTRVDDGQWHHVAGVFDNGTLIIYIDGNPEAPAYGNSTFGRGNVRYGFLSVGSEASSFDGNKGPNNYFNGDMDDVRIYDRALDANEIAQLAETLEFVDFTEAKVSSDDTSITISMPDTNEGDLLIAAVATDGDTSTSLAPVGGSWVGVVYDYSNQVTLGAWYKLANASEPNSYRFIWTGGQKAYGWIMHFTGHDPANPINAYSIFGQSSSTPISPAVTTTVNNCLILRLGAFDNDDITEGVTGLTGTTITMTDSGSSGATLFSDGFESGGFGQWTRSSGTSWDITTAQTHSGTYSAHADDGDYYIISDPIDTSSYSEFTIDFWYQLDDTESGDIYLYLYDGSNYDNYDDFGTAAEDQWLQYQEVITDAQYLHSNFRIAFVASMNNWRENIWIDDVSITVPGTGMVSGGAGYLKQSTAGDSGTENFALTSSNASQMLTVAIAPADQSSEDCSDAIYP